MSTSDSERLYELQKDLGDTQGDVKEMKAILTNLDSRLESHMDVVEKHIDSDHSFQKEVLKAIAENTKITSNLKIKVAGISAGIASVGTLAVTFLWDQLFK